MNRHHPTNIPFNSPVPDTPYQTFNPWSPPFKNYSNQQHGWICPKCYKVYSPWIPSCDCAVSNDK